MGGYDDVLLLVALHCGNLGYWEFCLSGLRGGRSDEVRWDVQIV